MVEFKIIVDSREQKPFFISHCDDYKFPGLRYEIGALKTGDYSIKGMDSPSCQHSITIERKSLDDLFGSTGRGRARLEREFIRMADFDHAEFVIEADLKTIFKDPPPLSAMKPKTVYRTMLAFSQRYGVKVWPCPSRWFAEQHTFLTLQRFWNDRQINGKMEFCKI